MIIRPRLTFSKMSKRHSTALWVSEQLQTNAQPSIVNTCPRYILNSISSLE